jgi:hypothetical protein
VAATFSTPAALDHVPQQLAQQDCVSRVVVAAQVAEAFCPTRPQPIRMGCTARVGFQIWMSLLIADPNTVPPKIYYSSFATSLLLWAYEGRHFFQLFRKLVLTIS